MRDFSSHFLNKGNSLGDDIEDDIQAGGEDTHERIDGSNSRLNDQYSGRNGLRLMLSLLLSSLCLHNSAVATVASQLSGMHADKALTKATTT